MNEVSRAYDLKIPIPPIMVADCEPPLSIGRLQWFDMRDSVTFPQGEKLHQEKFAQLMRILVRCRQ